MFKVIETIEKALFAMQANIHLTAGIACVLAAFFSWYVAQLDWKNKSRIRGRTEMGVGVMFFLFAYIAFNTRYYIKHPELTMPEYLPLRYTYVVFVSILLAVMRGISDIIDRPFKKK